MSGPESKPSSIARRLLGEFLDLGGRETHDLVDLDGIEGTDCEWPISAWWLREVLGRETLAPEAEAAMLASLEENPANSEAFHRLLEKLTRFELLSHDTLARILRELEER